MNAVKAGIRIMLYFANLAFFSCSHYPWNQTNLETIKASILEKGPALHSLSATELENLTEAYSKMNPNKQQN